MYWQLTSWAESWNIRLQLALAEMMTFTFCTFNKFQDIWSWGYTVRPLFRNDTSLSSQLCLVHLPLFLDNLSHLPRNLLTFLFIQLVPLSFPYHQLDSRRKYIPNIVALLNSLYLGTIWKWTWGTTCPALTPTSTPSQKAHTIILHNIKCISPWYLHNGTT